jgi:hypothetical protein
MKYKHEGVGIRVRDGILLLIISFLHHLKNLH